MNMSRAIVTSAIVYITTFIIGLLATFVFNVVPTLENPSEIPPEMWYVSSISAILLMLAGSWWYFRSPKVTKSARNGFLLGITAVIVGFALDMVMLLPAGLDAGLIDSLLSYYAQPMFLGTLLLIIVVPTAYGTLVR